MDKFDKEFITELFLDSDGVSSINRLSIALSNVINDNSENIFMFSELMKKEYSQQMGTIVEPVKSNNQFYEDIVLYYSDEHYRKKFNMKKSTVQELIKFVKEFSPPDRSGLPIDKKVHIFLYFLTSNHCFKEIQETFGTKRSVSRICYEIASILSDQRLNFIIWPSAEEQHLTRIKVNSKFKLPNCVGFLDALRLNTCGVKDKSEGTLLLQAVCDESLMFIDTFVGPTRKTRKNKVYKSSPLALKLNTIMDFDNHILSDSQYRLHINLMTPFTSDEILTSEEMKFNETHWKARSYIGQAFEMLKERFKRVNYLVTNKPEVAQTFIYAACVLHNFVLLHEGNSEMKEETVTCDSGVTFDTDIVKTAHEKRQFLCDYINYIDRCDEMDQS